MDERGVRGREWLVAVGEMGDLIRSLDWSTTPLGARGSWPESLRALVGMVVASRFPMALLWGRDLVFIYNDAYRVIAGGKHPAALGRSTRDVWPEVWHINEPIFDAVMERGETIYLEDARFPINRHGYDEDAFFTLCYSPVRVAGGDVGGTLVTLQETTAQVLERRRTRDALAERTTLLRAISDTSADVIFAKDRQGRFLFANPAALALVGKPLDAVIGKTDAEVLEDAEAARQVMENDRRIMQSGVAEEIEERVPLADGSERVWLSRKSPYRDLAGAVVGLLGISRDITERKSAEASLRESEERYRALFTNMTEGFAIGDVVCDAAGAPCDFRFTEMNEAFERQTGLSREATRGRSIRAVLSSIEQSWIDAYGSVALGGPPRRFESYNRDLGRWFSVYCFGPAPRQFAILFTDVSDRKRADEALRASEEKFRSIFEQAAIGMARVRFSDARWIDVNDAFCRMLGRSRDEMLRTPWPEITHREDVDLDLVPFREMAAGRRESYAVEKRFLHADGRHVWAKLTLSLVRDVDGRPEHEIAIIEDIGDRKRAEEALRTSEERLRLALDGARMAGWEYDPASRRVKMTHNAGDVLGLRREQVHDDSDQGYALLHPDDVEEHRTLVTGAVETGGSYVSVYRHLREGEVLWLEERARAVTDPSGRTVRLVGVTQNVTERKRIEEALRSREAQFEALVEELHSGVALIDSTGRFTLYNRRFLELFGLAGNADVVNVNSQDWSRWQVFDEGGTLLAIDDHPVRKAALTRRAVRGQVVAVRLPSGGDLRWMIVGAEPMLAADGSVAQIICTYHDITDRKRAEARLREANEKLQDADRRKDEFLGMLSHELRNPLAPIRNALYILDHAAPTGEQARRAKEVANRQIAHVTRLVDDLLDVTRIARGKIELRRGDVDLGVVARRAADDYRAVMADRGLELAVDVPHERVIVNGDETRLAQVFGNLLSNATKFTPPGGRVSFSLRAEGERAVVHVRDTGPGIAPDVLPTIFEPFTQGKQTLARSEGGLGLGLSLVRGLVALHGGDVGAASATEGGTDFEVTLPLAPAGRAHDEPSAGWSGATRRSSGRRRVLVVDDNRDAAETLADVIAMMGHTAVVAYDAHAGLAKASEDLPDVVLCDIGLPGMDGYEFARQFRALASSHRVRLVALSGYAQPEDVARAAEAGFDAHVAKPPDPEKLASLVG